jgi:hypothetical protein
MLSTGAMRRRFTRQAAIGRPGLSTMVRAASSAILAGRCKSAPVTRRLRLAMRASPRPGMLAARLLAVRPGMLATRLLAAARPGMLVARRCTLAARLLVARLLAARRCTLAARLLAIQSPPARSASGHTIRKPELILATMASAIPVREPRC